MIRIASALLFALSTHAAAEAPRVAADILPVHSLVARVMEGVGSPDLVLPPRASPHGYAMRPSEARALQKADAVFWVGEGLTPWLERPLDTIAEDAVKVSRLDHPDRHRIDVAERGGHDVHEEHDDHAHQEHSEEDEHTEEDHAHEEHAEEEHAHDHGPVDPHAWLDPDNARAWLNVIAATLGEIDPENAALYAENAEAGQSEIDELVAEMSEILKLAGVPPYAVYHDAYRYLEEHFGLRSAASVLDTDADQPSPQRIAKTRDLVILQGVRRIFLEPQTNVSLIETIFDELPVTLCEIDPIGAHIDAGPKHYWDSMRALASEIATCGVS